MLIWTAVEEKLLASIQAMLLRPGPWALREPPLSFTLPDQRSCSLQIRHAVQVEEGAAGSVEATPLLRAQVACVHVGEEVCEA